MVAGQHPVFEAPRDTNVPIWRFMDFARYVAMLENGGLFFCRADKLGDPFEGSCPIANKELRAKAFEEIGFSGTVFSGTVLEIYGRVRREFAKWTMISCWHMNYHESAAMWNLYSKTDRAVAIRTTFARLRDCLDESTYVGIVKYLDYMKEWIPDDNLMWPYVYKRASYEHEKEVRAVVLTWPPGGQAALDGSAAPPRDGIWKPVELSSLIDTVFVAPTSPEWFLELVQKVTARHLPALRVTRSALDEEAFY